MDLDATEGAGVEEGDLEEILKQPQCPLRLENANEEFTGLAARALEKGHEFRIGGIEGERNGAQDFHQVVFAGRRRGRFLLPDEGERLFGEPGESRFLVEKVFEPDGPRLGAHVFEGAIYGGKAGPQSRLVRGAWRLAGIG